ncbi:T6SS immunity protein Tdi1 domain-containing protein [uncultured Lamprocystis sp.]|jgi:hypothetical protein|uniref:T6SS immunity protein Tdi1 domain-containing protein n=1 Tax=uncultured Lamprocystis sp. TaxID=543132 RepID=UPI0025D3D145|nr:T6SS immunity protein Tdi1 domain-containing protein [uncultured Lamprocystis sp.]
MEIVELIARAWGWTGIQPVKVVAENDFGNLMVRDPHGQYWRICPEDLYCKIIAADRSALDTLIEDEEFQQDWSMPALVEEAQAKVGPLEEGRKYCLKIPGLLGGEYGGDNLGNSGDAILGTVYLFRRNSGDSLLISCSAADVIE